MNADSDYRWLNVSPDYYPELKRFECAQPVPAKTVQDTFKRYAEQDDEADFINLFESEGGCIYWRYALEVQDFIQKVNYDLDFQYQWADICVERTRDAHRVGRIYGVVCFALDLADDDFGEDRGFIAYIARANAVSQCGMGEVLLNHACQKIQQQCEGRSNPLSIMARIHPENIPSKSMFARRGFEDYGVDPVATQYHQWVWFVK